MLVLQLYLNLNLFLAIYLASIFRQSPKFPPASSFFNLEVDRNTLLHIKTVFRMIVSALTKLNKHEEVSQPTEFDVSAYIFDESNFDEI